MTRRRVVVTGVGLVSSLGHDYAEVMRALRAGESGVRAVPHWGEHGIKCKVAGTIEGIDEKRQAAKIPKNLSLAMSDAALYASLAALDAVSDARLGAGDLEDERTACFVGSAAAGFDSVWRACQFFYGGEIRRIDPFTIFRCVTSTTSIAVATLLKVHGPSYSICSSSSSGAHNIGHAVELIQSGRVDRAVAGGAEDVSELIAAAFNALRMALSTGYNDDPARASRPYDADRGGLVLSGGAGIVVLEALDTALARGVRPRAEIAGCGANSDGYDLALPEPEGRYASACMRGALEDAGLAPKDVDYVNTHGTGTIDGDVAEVKAMRKVFGSDMPPFSSTKSMTGHAVAAAGAIELIFCTGMLEQGFLAPSINIDRLDPQFEGLPIVRETLERPVKTILTNSFGFGGTNAAVVLRRYEP